jgi:hypothetical protein
MQGCHLEVPDHREPKLNEAPLVESVVNSRRTFLIASAGLLLAGCSAAKTTSSTTMPGPVWRPREMPPIEAEAVTQAPLSLPGMPNNVIPRTQWATGSPSSSLMNPMLPVKHITIHHDGMEPFFAVDQRGTAWRLDLIRRSHREKGWGDIGYHFAIDREGRIWQGRHLNWQGAHVKDHNEGNVGVVTLGNFDRQTPAAAQLSSLNKCVSWLMKRYRVQLSNVRTHQEWAGARTACPGVNLQRYMVAVRKNHQLG